MTYQQHRETYEQPSFPLGLRVSWHDHELRSDVTGYINGYWGSCDGHPVALLYGVVPDNADEVVTSVWLHHNQVQPLS